MYGTLAPVGIQSVNHEVKGKEQMFLAWENHMFWIIVTTMGGGGGGGGGGGL